FGPVQHTTSAAQDWHEGQHVGNSETNARRCLVGSANQRLRFQPGRSRANRALQPGYLAGSEGRCSVPDVPVRRRPASESRTTAQDDVVASSDERTEQGWRRMILADKLIPRGARLRARFL